MEEHTLRYGGYIFVVYFWILAAALVSGVLIMLTHTSQVLNNIYYTSKSLSLLLNTQASLSKPARIIHIYRCVSYNDQFIKEEIS